MKKIGDVATYLSPSEWNFVTQIPAVAAIAWGQRQCYTACVGACVSDTMNKVVVRGHDHYTGKDITSGWLNKLGVVVEKTHTQLTALYLADGTFYVLTKRL